MHDSSAAVIIGIIRIIRTLRKDRMYVGTISLSTPLGGRSGDWGPTDSGLYLSKNKFKPLANKGDGRDRNAHS